MRILTGNDVALSFQEYVLNFGNEVLTFWVKGLTHFDVNSFTFNEQEMGMATISLDMFVQADMIPEFTSDWYVDFRGERFHLSTLEPAILKDNTSRFYRYSLIFRSQRDDLQRYQFADFVSVEETPQPVSYDFVLPLTIQEFIERVNINLGYYLDGWAIELSPDYMDNLNPDIYDGTERITVSFSRQSIWSVIQSIYETYGLRWTVSGKTISVGYAQSSINHVFEYGKDNGLTSIERINTNLDVFTRLSGRGSTRNIPMTYFKSDEDPDGNTLTSLIPINNLMPSNYRLYVQGWNDSGASMPPQSTDAAYLSGWNANNDGTRFIPQDFVVDYDAEAKYGLRHTSIDDNDDIYPTLRTPIVGVELIEADKDVTTITQEPVGNALLLNKALSTGVFQPDVDDTIYTGVFPITETKSSIKSKLVISYPTTMTFTGSVQCDISLIRDGVQVDTRRYEEFTDWGLPVKAEHEVEFYDIVSGNYSIRMRTRIVYTSATSKGGVIPTISTELSQPIATASVVKTYKESFNIWIGNVWGSTKEVGKTDEEYTKEVWTPLKSTLDEITVMFADGLLAGSDYEFKIKEGGIHYDTSKAGSHWRLDLMKSDAEYETSGFMLPNSDRNAEVGDNIFFININMPFHPYVYDAEERLQDYLDKQLSYISTENPTYTIKPSEIFLEGFDENDSIKVGTVVPIKNQHIIGSGTLYLTVSNLTITYTSDKQLPTWDIVVSETPALAKNSIQTLQGEVKVLSTSMRSAQEMAEDITLQMDSRYLRRDGDTQKSYSPTQFTRPVTMDELSSSDYLQGLFGGVGYSIQKNADGDYVLEVDRINARKSLSVIELIVNQITAHGGVHIYSAASLTVSRVADGKVYFDTKNGTVHNQFVVGDFARGQRFNPSSSYWVEVTEVGVDYIVLDGATPLVGDVIAQLGNTSNVSRQSALIIDQTNGGTVTQYAYINSPSLENKDFVKYGVNPSTGKAFNIVYGDAYIGGRNPATDNYVAFDSGSGEIAFRGRIKQDSLAEDNGGNTSPITVDRGEYSSAEQYYVGNILTYLGSTYYCHTTPPNPNTPPTSEEYFRLYASAGESNLNLITSTQSISVTPSGNLFSQSIQVRLQYGTSFISVAEWSELEISYSGLTYSPITTPSASVLSINLNGFANEKTTVGFVTVNVTHFGVPMTLVISIARVFNPIQVAKGDYVSGQTYTGNCIQRDVVSYLGDYYAVRPTVGTTSTTWVASEWEALNSYKNVATDTLFANNANIAGFVYLNETMSSQTGTINGDTSTNWAHPDFVPNLVLDGINGTGRFSGELNGASGTFTNLTANSSGSFINIVDGQNYTIIKADGSQFQGDIMHQGYNTVKDRISRFYSQDIWCRSAFGSYTRTGVVVTGDSARFYTKGLDVDYYETIPLISEVDGNSNTYYRLPLYGVSGDAAGMPIEMVIFNVPSVTYRYELIGVRGKKATLINANDVFSVNFGYMGGWRPLGGGQVHDVFFLGDLLYPAQTPNLLGYGVMIGARADNDWS